MFLNLTVDISGIWDISCLVQKRKYISKETFLHFFFFFDNRIIKLSNNKYYTKFLLNSSLKLKKYMQDRHKKI